MAIWNIQTLFIGVCAVCTAWIFHIDVICIIILWDEFNFINDNCFMSNVKILQHSKCRRFDNQKRHLQGAFSDYFKAGSSFFCGKRSEAMTLMTSILRMMIRE